VYGIKETKDVVAFVAQTKQAVKLAKANDGKVDINDFGIFFGVVPFLMEAINGAGEIPKEWDDLDENEITELVEAFGEIVYDPFWQMAFNGALLLARGLDGILSKDAA